MPSSERLAVLASSEASFLALEGDPLAGWTATRRITLRAKRGVVLDLSQ